MSSTFRRHLGVGVVVSFVLASVMQFLEFKGTFANAEGSIADFYLRVASYAQPEPRVVTIGISADDYRDFFGATSPLDPVAVTSLVDAIRRQQPLVVGVDLITDSAKYLELGERPTDASTDSAGTLMTPVVWAAGGDARVEPATFFKRVFWKGHDVLIARPGAVRGQDPEQRIDWGLAVFATDEDGVVRRLVRRWHTSADQEPPFENVFARAVAERYCLREGASCADVRDADEAFMAFDADSARPHDYAVSELFQCTDPARVPDPTSDRTPCRQWETREGTKRDWNKSVVLLGGTFPEGRDFHETPRGRISGLALNAAAVKAEIFGGLWRPFGHFYSFLLDILIGVCVTLCFLVFHSLRYKVAASVLLSLPALLLGAVLFSTGIVWVGWVGMLLTGLPAHIVIETFIGAGHGATEAATIAAPAYTADAENDLAGAVADGLPSASAGGAEIAGAPDDRTQNNLG